MRRWFRILHWAARARYWKQRALAAESEVGLLKIQLKAEFYRNQQREDMFVSASIMGQKGMWGVAPRNGPAVAVADKAKPQPPDPYNLSGPDLMEFETFWKPDAEAMGIPIQQAKQEFVNKVVIPRRMPLNDDPFTN